MKRIPKTARNVLSAAKVKALSEKGLYADGGNLYLQIGPDGGKSWIFRYYRDHKLRNMGLGPLVDVPLARAREKAAELRNELREGLDPLEERRARRALDRAAKASQRTFKWCAGKYIEEKSAGWKNPKHKAQWSTTLETYAYPKLGAMLVNEITMQDVKGVIAPIWSTKRETANRVRGRIELVLSWATVHKYRSGENPARWEGNLKLVMPGGAAPKNHLPALPYRKVHEFVQQVRGISGVAAAALEFTILTAARTGEVIGATWDEINGDVWTVPAPRMKGGREHVIPLSGAAKAVLERVRPLSRTWIFPGQKRGQPLSNMAMLQTLRKGLERDDITVHGFRSCFRDWAAEETMHQNEVIEMALAHKIADKTEEAYRRGNLMEKRQRLMDDWARYIDTPPGDTNVSQIRRTA